MSAEEQKALGADAWTAGDYNKAIEHFTNAIDLSVDNDFLKVLYSNRSAAQLKMKQSAAALVDAEKCISIDGNWLKGYTRKGDALYAQLKYSEAYNAYNSGLRVDKNDKTLQEKAERAMNAISASSTPSSGGGGWGSSSGAGSSYTSNAAPTAPGMLGKAQWYLQLLTMGCAFLYLIPFFGRSFSTTCFRVTVGSSLGGRLITLYTKYGVPKFSSEYGSRIAQDPATNTLFLAAILLVSRPYLLPVVAIFLVEFAAVTPYIFTVSRCI
jgi:tetratricopeptide (TPR) repeat protein